MMLESQGGTFPCHKTVDYTLEAERDEPTNHIPSKDETHCAGALIFAEKNGNATQMMRISERFGDYDRAVFSEEAKASVWDNLGQWLMAVRPKRSKTKR